MKILIACEYSGVVRDEFLALGHDAMSCDILETDSPGPHYKGDVRDVLNDEWDMMIAHPECTRLTNAGVRWLTNAPPSGKTFPEMWKGLFEGAAFYKLLRDAKIPRKAIENPVMHCYAQQLIEPRERQIVQPWYFGDKAFKATGFELYGLPQLKDTNRLVPPKKEEDPEEHKRWSAIHMASPGPNRAKIRSKSFPGMARAMAMQWGGDIRQMGIAA